MGVRRKRRDPRLGSQIDWETRDNSDAGETLSENGDDTEDETSPATLSSLRKVVAERLGEVQKSMAVKEKWDGGDPTAWQQ